MESVPSPAYSKVPPLAVLLLVLPWLTGSLPTATEGLSRLEQEEIAFMRSSLQREIEDLGSGGSSPHGGDDEQEYTIRRAYRNIARRYKKNIFNDPAKFEFQMRILNLARDALVSGEQFGGIKYDHEEEEENGTTGKRELPPGNRVSDDILKQMHSWQEYGLEENIHFDDPETPYFVGHTQHAFREAFQANWTHFVREELTTLWPAAGWLSLQASMDGSQTGEARGWARKLAYAAQQLSRNELAEVAGELYACGANDPPLEGHLPQEEDTTGWVDLQLKVSRNIRSLFAGAGATGKACSKAGRESRLSMLEMNLRSLELLRGEDGDGKGRADVEQEVRAAHAAVMALRMSPAPEHCREVSNHKRVALEKVWEEYQFGVLVKESYPLDACAVEGLAAFLDFHAGPGGELLSRRAEPDRTVLCAVRGLHALQIALVRPASLSAGQLREAVEDLETAVWQGIAFPELHEATGRLMAEIAGANLLPDVLEGLLEHPRVYGGSLGTVLKHGREPSDVQPAREIRFGTLDVPGYSLKPVQRYEERALRTWGNEDEEDHWDPVRLGLAYIDLTGACDLPIQVAMCFVSAALWFWRALQLLGDNCGGDKWLEDYIFEDLYSVPPEGKRLAMQFALKTAICEFIEYASLMADHQLMPGARLAVQRSGYLLLQKVTARFGAEEDAKRVMAQLRRQLLACRLNPVWTPPVLLVADALFIDILAGRLHAAFIDQLHQDDGKRATVLTSTQIRYALYEVAMLGGLDLVNATYARFEVMGALLHQAGRHWEDITKVLTPVPYAIDHVGFATGKMPGWQPQGVGGDTGPAEEFVAVRGIRLNLQSGEAAILLTRPQAGDVPLLAALDVVEGLSLGGNEPLHVSLDPASSSGGKEQFAHNPFQMASAGISGLGRRLEYSLLHAALAIQQVASGTEVAMQPPFPLRPCEEGLCRGLPRDAKEYLGPLGGLRGEQWEAPSRLVLECSRLSYWQKTEGHMLEILFGEPTIEAHAGKPLRVLNEEEFRTWPVAKLRSALRRVEGEDFWHQEQMPVLEKQELVDRLLRALESGRLLEDDEDIGDPLARFSRRLTHFLPKVAARWAHIARLAPLCALRAAGLVLRHHLQQVNESVTAQIAEMRASAGAQTESLRAQQAESWRGALAEVHSRVLLELGFVDLDPGGCWSDAGPLTFGRCCSVGDYADECWPDGKARELECCGPAARRQGMPPQLIAAVAAQLGSASPRRPNADELFPAVDAWLQSPTGRGEDGTPLSANVVALLAEELAQDALVQGTEEQLRRPVELLSANLEKLKPQGPGLLPIVGTSGPTGWVPAPPLTASGGRRVVYATVVLAPQLQAVDADSPQVADVKGQPLEAVPFEELVHIVAEPVPEANLDPQLEAVWEATALLRDLDDRTEVAENAAKGRGADSPVGINPETNEESCGFDGWRELGDGEAETAIGFGDRIKVRRRGDDDIHGHEGMVRRILTLAGSPGDVRRVWEVAVSGGPDRHFDLTDPSYAVYQPCSTVANSAGPGLRPEFKWPDCVQANVAHPSADGAGLFVNLGALKLTEGCFQNDCSYSDHFACATPADCARTCAKIGACRRWTFSEAAPATCWLRGEGTGIEEAMGAVSGTAACIPPLVVGPVAPEPTLFQLVQGPAGTPPPALWEEWDLVEVLEEFGHMTLREVQRAPASRRKHAALRAAALANPRCASSWRGCTI